MEERTIPSHLPVIWKTLQPKNPTEVYFAGNQKKKNKRKDKSNHMDLMIDKQHQTREQSPGYNTWDFNQVKEIFPQLKNQHKLEDQCYEDVKVLSLEDFKVYTRRVAKNNFAREELWDAADFPSIAVGAGVNSVGNKIKAECVAAISNSSSVNLKKHEVKKDSSECITFGNVKSYSSKCCQTDHLLFTKNYQDANVKYLCANLPTDLRQLFLNFLSEREELIRLLDHLLKVLCDFGGNIPQASTVPLMSSVLSQREKALILSKNF